MADILEGMKGILMHPINEAKWYFKETKNIGKPLLKGDMSGTWKAIKAVPGNHQDMMSDTITVPLLGDNKIAKNSDAIVGAAMLGGAALAGGMGGGAGGAAGAGGSGSGFGASFVPQTAFGSGAGSAGTGMSTAGLSSTGLSGATGAGGLSTGTTAAGGFSSGVTGSGLSGGITSGEIGAMSGVGGSGFGGGGATGSFDWEQLARTLQSVKGSNDQQNASNRVSAPNIRTSGFQPVKLTQDERISKALSELYSAPLTKVSFK